MPTCAGSGWTARQVSYLPNGPRFPLRRAIQRYVEKYLFNPGMRTAIGLGCAPRIFALLETTGRRTGLTRRTPVTVATDGDVIWLVAEHGWGCGYVRNISAEPRVRLKIGRYWHAGRAVLVPEDDAWRRRAAIDRHNGWLGRADGVFFKVLGSQPMTVRVDLAGPSP